MQKLAVHHSELQKLSKTRKLPSKVGMQGSPMVLPWKLYFLKASNLFHFGTFLNITIHLVGQRRHWTFCNSDKLVGDTHAHNILWVWRIQVVMIEDVPETETLKFKAWTVTEDLSNNTVYSDSRIDKHQYCH
jgi:hypothetical protein